MGVMSQLLILFAALVVGWLLKSFMPSYLSQKGKNLATKEDIAEITAKIEGVKTDLRKGAFEHEVRFSKLHERRAEVLAEIYKRLVVTTWHVTNLGSAFQFVGTPSKQSHFRRAQNMLARYYRFLDQHRIFLPRELCNSLEAFPKELRPLILNYGVFLDIEYPTPQTKKETEEERQALQAFVESDVPRMRLAIEEEFRKLLGVEPPHFSAT